MKKFLLFAGALAVAFAASAFTLATKHQTLQPRPFNGMIEKAAMPFKAPAQRIADLTDIPGEYVAIYGDYFDDNALTSFNCTIEQGATENALIIKDFWFANDATKDLNATLDPQTGIITIPRQPIYEYEGDAPADLVNPNDPDEALTAVVYSNGIVFQCPWGAMITEGDYEGYYYAIGNSTILFEPNATMAWTVDNSNVSINVYVEQDDSTKQVMVGNFGEMGVPVYIDLASDHTFNVPNQLVLSSQSGGDFYTYGINGALLEDIPGTGTATTLTADTYWTFYAPSTNYWYGQLSPFVITRTDDEEFEWPVDPAMYLIGSFNGWSADTQLPMTLDDGKWVVTQEMDANAEFKFRNEKDEWIGAESDGNFIVQQEQVENGTEITLGAGDGYMNLQIPVAGTWTLTIDPETMKLVIAGEWVEPGEEQHVYILGNVGDNDWAPNVGVEMTTVDNNIFTAEVNFKGSDEGYSYFSFTTQLGEDAEDWDAIAPYRFGAVSEGNFLVTDEWIGPELTLTYENGQAYQIPGGDYTLTVNMTEMTLVINKKNAPVGVDGDLNGDGNVDVEDLNLVINVILNNGDTTGVVGNPDVNGDSICDVEDVNAIINLILNN